ncbi:hypothetical protein IE81DRAFT_349317 [Ceraceosorus guamensis]|uniref:Uncharacterized protein n=1 Tax=Ceraceosorus guamensis TaxID=1522189 RepID=A0A316VV79_9BASI|nr:hypothetical protein IE81DRAFT_349317 [Ceraceosorus guamensis]PWN40343.1 hypothetical protein IE81DRAFT_349317 [Ceraceosorus guamensis]
MIPLGSQILPPAQQIPILNAVAGTTEAVVVEVRVAEARAEVSRLHLVVSLNEDNEEEEEDDDEEEEEEDQLEDQIQAEGSEDRTGNQQSDDEELYNYGPVAKVDGFSHNNEQQDFIQQSDWVNDGHATAALGDYSDCLCLLTQSAPDDERANSRPRAYVSSSQMQCSQASAFPDRLHSSQQLHVSVVTHQHLPFNGKIQPCVSPTTITHVPLLEDWLWLAMSAQQACIEAQETACAAAEIEHLISQLESSSSQAVLPLVKQVQTSPISAAYKVTLQKGVRLSMSLLLEAKEEQLVMWLFQPKTALDYATMSSDVKSLPCLSTLTRS